MRLSVGDVDVIGVAGNERAHTHSHVGQSVVVLCDIAGFLGEGTTEGAPDMGEEKLCLKEK